MSDLLVGYLCMVLGAVVVISGFIFGIARHSANKDGKKLDAIRKERADLERQLRNLKQLPRSLDPTYR